MQINQSEAKRKARKNDKLETFQRCGPEERGRSQDKPSQALKLRPTENLKKDIDIWLSCQQMEI